MVSEPFDHPWPTTVCCAGPLAPLLRGPAPLVVVIPGNPGLADYYSEFVDALARRVPAARVVCVLQAGFVPGSTAPLAFYLLEDQIRHKVEVVEALGAAGRPIHLLGHSVGAYMTQRVAQTLAARPGYTVALVGLLTPTVSNIALLPNGVMLTRLLRWVPWLVAPATVGLLAWLVSLVPLAARRWVVERRLGQPQATPRSASRPPTHAVAPTLALVSSYHLAWQALALARQEMAVIGNLREYNNQWFAGAAAFGHVYVVLATNDRWVGADSHRRLASRDSLPHVLVEQPPGIPHSFCIHQLHPVAQVAAERIGG